MTALNTPISTTVSNEENNIKKQGYLLKESRWFKKNRKRYCVLTNGVIYAYKTNESINCTFDSKQATECFNLITDYKYVDTIPNKKQFVLSRSSNKKSVRIFTTNSIHNLIKWVECIKKTQPHYTNNDMMDLSPSTNTMKRILRYNHKNKEHQIMTRHRSNSQPNPSIFTFISDSKEDMDDYMCDNHAFYDESIDNNNKQNENNKLWKCKECYYNNRDVMVGTEWTFSHSECGLCGHGGHSDNKCEITENEKSQSQMKNSRSRNSVQILHICDEEQLQKWKQIKKHKIYDDIKCGLTINNSHKLYFERCDIKGITDIIHDIITIQDDKLYKIKNDIIKCCIKQNINGKKLQQIGRKGFTREIAAFIGYNSLNAHIAKLYSRIKKYDIDCNALKRICFILKNMQSSRNVKEFINDLYTDSSELLDDVDHIVKHREILNMQPYIKCTCDNCECYERILNQNEMTMTQKQHLFQCKHLKDINYQCYLDCIHVMILHNKMDEISHIMEDYAHSIRKYAKYSVHDTKDFVDYKSTSPFHKNLKEELTCLDEFEKTLQSTKAVFDSGVFEYGELKWKANQSSKEYGIEFCDTIPIECVLSIKLYCQHSGLRRQIRESNNERFYWIKRYLYIATTFYGSPLKISDYFYQGLPEKQLFDKFSIMLNSPTSTTSKLNVATKYAGDYGIVLKLSMKYKNTVNLSRCLETKSISNYDNEERIFYGMELLSIIDIIVYNGKKWTSYNRWINSMLYFERIIEQSHQPMDYNHGYIDKQTQETYLLSLIQHQMDRNSIGILFNMTKNIPEYVFVLFEHFCDSKRDSINLSLIMNEVKEMSDELKHILFTTINGAQEIQINKPNIRLIFPNLHRYKDPNCNWISLENNSNCYSIDSKNTGTKVISELTQCAQLINMQDIGLKIDINESEISHNYANNNTPNTPFSPISEPDDEPLTIHTLNQYEHDHLTIDSDDNDNLSPITPIPDDHVPYNAFDVNAPEFKPSVPSLQLSASSSFKSQASNASLCALDTIEEKDDEKESKTKTKINHKRHDKPQYFPPNRAQGRIHIVKRFTNQQLPSLIKETFVNLYDYMDKLTAIHECIRMFGEIGSEFGVINYRFHDKMTNEELYCVIKRQDEKIKKNRNYSFKMVQKLFTAKDLAKEYNIESNQLPKSLIFDTDLVTNEIESIQNILKNNTTNTMTMIRKTKWQKVAIFKRVNNINRRTQYVEKNTFIKKCITFFQKTLNDINLIPILMFDDRNAHWIEYVWIVCIENDINIGISLTYDDKQPNKLKVNGIHLDKEYLLLQHQLLSWKHDCNCLDSFSSCIHDYHIGNPDDLLNKNKNLQKQVEELQQIKQKFNNLQKEYFTEMFEKQRLQTENKGLQGSVNELTKTNQKLIKCNHENNVNNTYIYQLESELTYLRQLHNINVCNLISYSAQNINNGMNQNMNVSNNNVNNFLSSSAQNINICNNNANNVVPYSYPLVIGTQQLPNTNQNI